MNKTDKVEKAGRDAGDSFISRFRMVWVNVIQVILFLGFFVPIPVYEDLFGPDVNQVYPYFRWVGLYWALSMFSIIVREKSFLAIPELVVYVTCMALLVFIPSLVHWTWAFGLTGVVFNVLQVAIAPEKMPWHRWRVRWRERRGTPSKTRVASPTGAGNPDAGTASARSGLSRDRPPVELPHASRYPLRLDPATGNPFCPEHPEEVLRYVGEKYPGLAVGKCDTFYYKPIGQNYLIPAIGLLCPKCLKPKGNLNDPKEGKYACSECKTSWWVP